MAHIEKLSDEEIMRIKTTIQEQARCLADLDENGFGGIEIELSISRENYLVIYPDSKILDTTDI